MVEYLTKWHNIFRLAGSKNIKLDPYDTEGIELRLKHKYFNGWYGPSWRSIELFENGNDMYKSIWQYCSDFHGSPHYELSDNDLKLIEIIGSCNSFEELKIKCDLYFLDI